MDFLNRKDEIARLNRTFGTNQSKLAVVYGRRRLGKTRLLQQVLKKDDIYFIADQRESAIQIESFARLIAAKIEAFDKVTYPDWESLFISLSKRIKKGITVFIDEFPYLVKNAPALPGIIQTLVDSRESLSFHLVLCGSSQQMMQKMVIDHSSPLYGRADEIIKIAPMSVYWLKQALNCSYAEAIEEYSVFGGVPRYWEIRNEAATLKEAITRQIFNIHGVLHEEPQRLFLDDTRDAVQMHTLISVIATGAHRLSEISSRLGKPATQLNRPLQKLIELGYIKREIPWNLSIRNTKKTLYKINDPFIHFYYRYVIPNKTSLELGYIDQIYRNVFQKTFSDFSSEAWEEMCRRAIPGLFEKNIFEPGSRWWGTGINKQPIEIDIVAQSFDKKKILIGEAKWSSNRNIPAVIRQLEQRAGELPFTQGKKVILSLFLKEKPQKDILSNVLVFTPEDIVKANV